MRTELMVQRALIVLVLLSVGCATPLVRTRDVQLYPPGKNVARVRVLYATDRNYSGSVLPAERFGAGRGDRLRYGWCDVSVPRDHRLGKLESPTILKLELSPNPKKHWVVVDTHPLRPERFYGRLHQTIGVSPGMPLLVFVHGFRVTFDDAVRRTAQIAYDLGYPGIPITYSWPSAGTAAGYGVDYDSAAWSATHFEDFLRRLARDSGATEIHVVAHSMGNVVLTRALEAIHRSTDAGTVRSRLREVVLAAPDVDADILRQLTGALRATTGHVTLYASANDQALRLSRELRGGMSRAGDADPVFVAPGIDTIDASTVDTDFIGHSYYGDNRSILADIFHLVRTHASPAERFGLLAVTGPSGRYWVFVPGGD